MLAKHAGGRRAFTMNQLVIAILVIATLIALAVPIAQKARERQARTDSTINLKAIGLALLWSLSLAARRNCASRGIRADVQFNGRIPGDV